MTHRAFLFVRILTLATLVFLAFGDHVPMGDGCYYYAYLPSIWLDHDLDLSNEYRMYNPMRAGIVAATGRPFNIYPIGTAILWSPFFLLAHLVTHLANWGFCAQISTNGFSASTHFLITLWGTVVYGSLGLVIAARLTGRWYGDTIAWSSVLGVALASPFAFYWCASPSMSHVPTAFAVTLAIDLLMRGNAAMWSPGFAFGVGASLGLCLALRPANCAMVLLILPSVISLISGVSRGTLSLARASSVAAALAIGLVVGVSPLLVSWKVIFGSIWPIPQASQLDLSQPALREMLFSTRHGLLTWTPILSISLLGMFLFSVRVNRIYGPLLILVYGTTAYVNSCADDWWAGYAFGLRRMVDLSVIPMIGLGALLKYLEELVIQKPGRFYQAIVAVVLVCAVLLNLGMAAAFRTRQIHPSSTLDSVTLYAAGLRSWYTLLGNPLTWPASVPFSLEFRTAPWRYDLLEGRYFLHGEYNCGDTLEFGRHEHRIFLTRGWADLDDFGTRDVPHVWTSGERAEIALPLFGPGPYALSVRLKPRQGQPPGLGTVSLLVNGRLIGSPVSLLPDWHVYDFEMPAHSMRKGINHVCFAFQRGASRPIAFERLSLRHEKSREGQVQTP